MTPVWIAAFAIALAACGDNEAALDAGAADAPPPPCTASFADNFVETWMGPAGCAELARDGDHTTLRLAIPSRTVDATFAIAIDLGAAPGPGLYTSRSLATPWSAEASHDFEMTSCLYHAGAGAVPPGSFTLALDALDDRGAHGRLDVTLYVLARPYTYCGETLTEQLGVVF